MIEVHLLGALDHLMFVLTLLVAGVGVPCAFYGLGRSVESWKRDRDEWEREDGGER